MLCVVSAEVTVSECVTSACVLCVMCECVCAVTVCVCVCVCVVSAWVL